MELNAPGKEGIKNQVGPQVWIHEGEKEKGGGRTGPRTKL